MSNYSDELRNALRTAGDKNVGAPVSGTATQAQVNEFINARDAYRNLSRANVGLHTQAASDRVAALSRKTAQIAADSEAAANHAAEQLKARRDALAKQIEGYETAGKRQIEQIEERVASAKKRLSGLTEASHIDAQQRVVNDLEDGLHRSRVNITERVGREVDAARTAAKQPLELLEQAAEKSAKTAKLHADRHAKVADAGRRFHRGEIELHTESAERVAKTKIVDGKTVNLKPSENTPTNVESLKVSRSKVGKVANEAGHAKAFTKMDNAYEAIADKDKINEAPKYKKLADGVETTASTSTSSSVASSTTKTVAKSGAKLRYAEAMPEMFGGHGLEVHGSEKAVTEAMDKFNGKAAELEKHIAGNTELRGKFGKVASDHAKVRGFETLKDGKWIEKEGLSSAQKEAYATAKKALEESRKAAAESIKHVEGKTPAIFKEFAESRTAVDAFKKQGAFTAGITSGKVKALGFGGALKDNLNVFGKDAAGKGNIGIKAARIGGVGVGLYMAKDALARDKTSDGEDRSMFTRFVELAAGLGISGFSALGGAAR